MQVVEGHEHEPDGRGRAPGVDVDQVVHEQIGQQHRRSRAQPDGSTPAKTGEDCHYQVGYARQGRGQHAELVDIFSPLAPIPQRVDVQQHPAEAEQPCQQCFIHMRKSKKEPGAASHSELFRGSKAPGNAATAGSPHEC